MSKEIFDKMMSKKTFPCVIVCEGKHNAAYFNGENPEKVAQSCLKILSNRFKDSWYYHEDKIYERIKKAVDEKDGYAAYLLLRERSDYEYEQIRVVSLE